MITAQDIREKGFEKTRKDGYDLREVDEFLEEVADSITAYQKENSVLKSKMKVLVDKIEEYRANEETLNMAILSAQKLAVQIESDARNRAAAMISDAEKRSNEIIGSIAQRREEEERKLEDAKTITEKFFESARSLCSGQLSRLDELCRETYRNVKKDSAKAAEEDAGEEADQTVRTISQSVSKIQDEPSVKFDLNSAMKAPSEPRKSFGNTQSFKL